MGIIDILVFIIFVSCVIGLGLYKSRNEKTGEDYFLAGRGLKWWLIGFSLIAANISSEQFVGMSGNAASHVGLAVASYEWLSAVTLVIVAFFFLPYFLRAGIYTMPEFLEYRYNAGARLIMAITTLLIYMLLLGAITYSGALTIETMAQEMEMRIVPTLMQASLFIALIAMVYVAAGGLKACAWADLIQGSALIVGGAIIMFFAFNMLGNAEQATYVEDVRTGEVAVHTFDDGQGAMQRFMQINRVRLNMFLPSDDPVLPWTALLLGLWIPCFYYWGLNQYITQRTLGSASLAEGQKGIVFSAFMKLLIPFVIVVPGIIAFNLFAPEMKIRASIDNAPVIARYWLANPDTQMVEVRHNPSAKMIETWQSNSFMLAVFTESGAMREARIQNPFVLPITEEVFNRLEARPFSVFTSDDKAIDTVFPMFAEELYAYNRMTEEAADAAGTRIHGEKFIGYKYDSALGQLLSRVLPRNVGLVGFVLAALMGAIVSSLAAMLNAASTIFTMDIYRKYINPDASQKVIVLLGRCCVVVFSIIAFLLAPQLGNPRISHSIFIIIQESQGFLSPGILAVFVFGLVVHKAPRFSGVLGLLSGIVVYGVLKYVSMKPILMEGPLMGFLAGNFLNRMAITFLACLLVMVVASIVRPLSEPIEFTINTKIELHSSKGAMLAGIVIIVVTAIFYLIFSPLGIARS